MRYRSCALSPTPVSVTVATAWLPAASAVTVTVPPEGVARPAILVAGLLGPDAAPYTQGRCCYDLCRLKLKGLIVKIEHTDTYVLTPDGQRFAVFYTKVHNRLLRPLLAADRPPAPLPVRGEDVGVGVLDLDDEALELEPAKVVAAAALGV